MTIVSDIRTTQLSYTSGAALISPTGQVIVDGASAIVAAGSGVDLVVDGYVGSVDGIGIDMEGADPGVITLYIGSGGAVSSVGLWSRAVEMTVGTIYFTNNGSVLGHAYSLHATGVQITVHNSGVMEGALVLTGSLVSMHNSGSTDRIGFTDVTTGRLFNAGFAVGAYVTGEEAHLVNVGELGIVVTASDAATTLRNSGVVGNAQFSYFAYPHEGPAQTQTIVNTGSMLNDIWLGAAGDVIRGATGFIGGVIKAGNGRDVISSGIGDDLVEGQGGDDDLRGGEGRDRLDGGAGSDHLHGGPGDDELEGGGGVFDDVLVGGAGADSLRDGGGNDQLHGGAGDDVLFGGGGDDLLDGGRDDDVLTGCNGRDVFRVARAAGDDRVRDFQDGFDRIDLEAFGFRPSAWSSEVAPALSSAGPGATMLDLAMLGGAGSVLIEGLAVADADAGDFIL